MYEEMVGGGFPHLYFYGHRDSSAAYMAAATCHVLMSFHSMFVTAAFNEAILVHMFTVEPPLTTTSE